MGVKLLSLLGAKRAKLDSKFQLQNNVKRRCHHGGEDRISQLLDDILLHIMSLLSLKESVLTSALSSRWINLCKHFPCLNFNALGLIEMKRRKYVKWVNNVLKSHKALTLKELNFRFKLGRSFTKTIKRWLEFAFSRHVERLELDLSFLPIYESYCFPDELLTRSNIYFKSLKALSFKGVDVSGEAIDFFLSNCQLLEQLVVHRSDKLSNFEVCGASLMLKHLEIVDCDKLKSIKVSAPCLTSLELCHKIEGLLFENVPMLVDVSVGYRGCDICEYICECDSFVKCVLGPLSCCNSQLEILSLKLDYDEAMIDLCEFPELPKLKKLMIEFTDVIDDKSLVGLTALIGASPCLEEFVLRLESDGHFLERSNGEVINVDSAAITSLPDDNLKVFQFCGYYGDACDVELVKYILDKCSWREILH